MSPPIELDSVGTWQNTEECNINMFIENTELCSTYQNPQ